jgi:hypothetical protein
MHGRSRTSQATAGGTSGALGGRQGLLVEPHVRTAARTRSPLLRQLESGKPAVLTGATPPLWLSA